MNIAADVLKAGPDRVGAAADGAGLDSMVPDLRAFAEQPDETEDVAAVPATDRIADSFKNISRSIQSWLPARVRDSVSLLT